MIFRSGAGQWRDIDSMTDEPTGPSATPVSSVVSMGPVFMAQAGALAAVYGTLLALVTWAQWSALQPPGTVIGPPSFVQSLMLRIDQGAYLLVVGGIMAFGGWVIFQNDTRRRARVGGSRPPRWRAPLLVVAVLLLFVTFVVGILPTPVRTLSLVATDFTLAPGATSNPAEIDLVSAPFPAAAGEDFFSVSNVTYRNLTSGAVAFIYDWASSYVKGLADPYGPRQFGFGNVAASSGSYVVVIEALTCDYFSTSSCANFTLDAAATVWVWSPQAYLPLQAALGIASSAIVVGVAVQSGLGSRRMTS